MATTPSRVGAGGSRQRVDFYGSWQECWKPRTAMPKAVGPFSGSAFPMKPSRIARRKRRRINCAEEMIFTAIGKLLHCSTTLALPSLDCFVRLALPLNVRK
jgi:hypothetical protein